MADQRRAPALPTSATRPSSRGATPPSSTTTRGRRWAARCRGRLGSSTSRDERERAGTSHGRLHAGGSTTTSRRLGRLGRAAPSRTGRAPYPARRRSHSDEKRGGTVDSPIHQRHSSSGAWPRASAVRQAAPKAPRAAAGLGVMLRHSFGDGSPSLGCCICLLYTSPSPRDKRQSRMPSSA